jgi:putative Mg2+ transporter-C (MgtC) family protein
MLFQILRDYWSGPAAQANAIVILNLVGAFLLGLILGYERYYRGRAAGMRTYGIVCMASAALTVIVGYPSAWYGGLAVGGTPDPTRVLQGIVTGVGFLGAGVIVKDGLSISGLTTAASIWASSAIGILVGIGFYGAAIGFTTLSVVCMFWVSRLELALPSRSVLAITLTFREGFTPREDILTRLAQERGYKIVSGSLCIGFKANACEWKFSASTINAKSAVSFTNLAEELTKFAGVESFNMAHVRF